GQVDCDDLVTLGQTLNDRLPHLPPAADPMYEHEGLAAAGTTVVELHAPNLLDRPVRGHMRGSGRNGQPRPCDRTRPANCAQSSRALPLYETAKPISEEIVWQAPRQPAPSAARFRNSPGVTCGCISRGCRPTRTTKSRSSSAVRAVTSTTSTESAISMASRR